MAIKKIAVAENILPSIVPLEKIASVPEVSSRFNKVLAELKESKGKALGRKISPKVDDFLYASCVMMHAAEASLIDPETGELKKRADGSDVSGGFEEFVDHKGAKSVKWVSADGIEPYKNGNGDIFPEEDLLLAYKDWVGKPLCRDHVSSTVDGIRGIIIDTFYDPKLKQVHALFALDRKNYGDLARKIEAGYATSVSMGTAVGKSICTTCGNVATNEAEFCSHVKSKSCYGEINKELSPIELSIVVTGADPKAKIKTVLANLKEYEDQVNIIASSKNIKEADLDDLQDKLDGMKEEVDDLAGDEDLSLNINEKADALLTLLGMTDSGDELFDEARSLTRRFIADYRDSLDELSNSHLEKLIGVLNHLELSEEKSILLPLLLERTESILTKQKDVLVGVTDNASPMVDTEGRSLKDDSDLMDESVFSGKPGDHLSQAPQNFASLYVNNGKTTNDATNLYMIGEMENKLSAMAEEIESLRNQFKEKSMTFSDLKRQALKRKSYFQGTEDPSKLPYDRMGDDHKTRESEDKQMVGVELDTSADNPDESEKKMLQRAELEERRERRAAMLASIKQAGKGTVLYDDAGKPKAVEGDAGKVHSVQNAKDNKNKKDDKGKKKDKDHKKKAYFQGTEDPSKLPYELMGDQEGLRKDHDRQMLQADNLGGEDGLVPGDEELKRGLQRLAGKKLQASLVKGSSPSESKWEFYAVAGDQKEKLLSFSAADVYGDHLNDVVVGNKTYSDFFHSPKYAKKAMGLIRKAGPEGAAEELGLDDDMNPEEDGVMMGGAEVEMEDLSSEKELADLREAISAAIEKIDVSLEDLKSAVSDDEGVMDLEVSMQEANPSEELMPMASVKDSDALEVFAFLTDVLSELSYLDLNLKGDPKFVSVAHSAVMDAGLAAKEASKFTTALRKSKALAKKANEMPAMDHGSRSEMFALDKEDREEVEEVASEVAEEVSEEVAEEVVDEALEDHEDEMHAKDHGMMGMDAHDHKLDDRLAARRARREALVAKAGKYDDLYEATRKSGGPTLGLDGDDKVETLHETHAVMEEVATKEVNSSNVREAAEKLDKAIKSGALNADKLDELVALAQVDAEAVAYYKQYFGQVDGGSEFASKLVNDFTKSAQLDNEEVRTLKIKRAYALGLEAQDKQVIGPGRANLDKFVDDAMNLPDNAFESFKNIVAQTKAPVKNSGVVPQIRGGSDGLKVSASKDASDPTVENLSRLFIK